MISVYKKRAIPKNEEVIKNNDVFFSQVTAGILDEKAEDVIYRIDQSKMIDKYSITSRFDGAVLNIDKLSTGCKTALNILFNPERIFDISECGENALEVIYAMPVGKIFCEYPLIAFTMESVEAVDASGSRIISDYDELGTWWKDED